MSRDLKIIDSNIALLSKDFHVDPEVCNNPGHYETYLQQGALIDYKKGIGVTYVMVENDKKIVGYVTVKAASLITDGGESHKIGYPAIEISELAVDKDYRGQGIGYELVESAIAIGLLLNENYLGVQYLVLCADRNAVAFYEKPRLGLRKLDEISDVPREDWNMDCVPMYKKIVVLL